MPDEEDIESSNIAAFIFRRAGIIFSVIFFTLNFLCIYIYKLPSKFESSAILIYELNDKQTTLTKAFGIKDPLSQERDASISSLYLDENLKKIMHKVWPSVDMYKDYFRFNSLLSALKNPIFGIQFQYQGSENSKKNNDNAAASLSSEGVVTVSYNSLDAQLCTKVVQSVIDVIISNNKERVNQKYKESIGFLNMEINARLKEIKEIDNKTALISKDLQGHVIVSATGDFSENLAVNDQPANSADKYQDMILMLQLDLVAAKKKRLSLIDKINQLNTLDQKPHLEDPAPQPQDLSSDEFLKQYDNEISAKKNQMQTLLASGYRLNYPDVKDINDEIERIQHLKDSRIAELQGAPIAQTQQAPVGAVSDIDMVSKIKDAISDQDLEIDTINSKIRSLKEYLQAIPAIPTPKDNTTISAKIIQLNDLKSEREESEKNLLDLRTKLDDTQLDNSMNGLKISVLQPPEVPISPNSPITMKLIVLCVFISVGFAFGLAYVIDSFDNPIRTKNELAQLIRLPVIAVIFQFNLSKNKDEERKRNVIYFGIFIIAVLLIDLFILQILPMFLKHF